MFKDLSSRLAQAINSLTGRGRLTEENIKDTLREVRVALLEADVALPIVKSFIQAIEARAIGQEVMASLTPGQALIKIVRDELILLMGEQNEALQLNTQPPAVILMAGLQGSGKTTTAAKLARLLKTRDKKSVLLASCDVYRPAAIEQLATLAKQVDVESFVANDTQDPVTIAKQALEWAKRSASDVVIIDTAGRLHIDEAMMAEIKAIYEAISPIETLFVVDSMTGQDAAMTAQAFHDALPLTGVILTKTDGDARGGAALSIRQLTGKPIKFMGVGEKVDALEPFYPDRVASRILGMGDVLGLIEHAEKTLDKENAKKMAKKLQKGRFDLDDFRKQISEMHKMGGLTGLIDKLPGMGSGMPNISGKQMQQGESDLRKFIAMIDSMTPQERRRPELISGSRKRRICNGSGTQIQEINRLLKQFDGMQKMMKKMSQKGGIQKMMRSMQGMMGKGGQGAPL